jgi:hypothetical protein
MPEWKNEHEMAAQGFILSILSILYRVKPRRSQSQSVAVINWLSGQKRISLLVPFAPFRGHSFIVNACCQFGFKSGQSGSNPVKPSQTVCIRSNCRQIACNKLTMNDLQNIRRLVQSNSVKVGQSDMTGAHPTPVRRTPLENGPRMWESHSMKFLGSSGKFGSDANGA